MASNIQLTCPGCDKQIEIPLTLLDKRGQCHECGRVGIIEQTSKQPPVTATLALPPEPEPEPEPPSEPPPPSVPKFKTPISISPNTPPPKSKPPHPKNGNFLSWAIISGASILIVGFVVWMVAFSDRKVPIVTQPPKPPPVETVAPPPEWENPTTLLRLLTTRYGEPADKSEALFMVARSLVKAGARDEAKIVLNDAFRNAVKIKDPFRKCSYLTALSFLQYQAGDQALATKTLEEAENALPKPPPQTDPPKNGRNNNDKRNDKDVQFNFAYRRIALGYCRMGNVDGGEKRADKIHARKYQDSVRLEMVDVLLKQSGNTTDARKVAEQIDIGNKDVRDIAFKKLILVNIAKQNFDEARDLVKFVSRKENIVDTIGVADDEWDLDKNKAETELNQIQNRAERDANLKDQQLQQFALQQHARFPNLAEEAASAVENAEIQADTWELLTQTLVNLGKYSEALRLAEKLEGNTRRRKTIFHIAVMFSTVRSPSLDTTQPVKVDFTAEEKLFAKALAEAMRKTTVLPLPPPGPPDKPSPPGPPAVTPPPGPPAHAPPQAPGAPGLTPTNLPPDPNSAGNPEVKPK